MGLDMYLQAKMKCNKDFIKLNKDYEKFNPNSISFDVAYWRKANAIHGYFNRLSRVRNGCEIENCQTFDNLEMADFDKLEDICKRILKAKGKNRLEIIQLELPPMEGFFFGNTNLDEKSINDYYMEDIKTTLENIARCREIYKLSKGNCWFEYHAWW